MAFTGTGNRITGDFSNATVANRVMFQTSTANSSTVVQAIPNGTGNNGAFLGFNNSDPTNAAFVGIQIPGSEARFASGITGTGSYLPMTFYTGGSERMRVDTSGNVGIGNTAANVNDQVGAVRPLLVSKSDTSTTIAGSQAAIVIGNADTTTSNTSQLSFAAITGGSSTYFTSAAINCVFGARTNGQYPTGQLTFSTSTSLNSAPTEKMRIDSSGNVGIGTSSPSARLHATKNNADVARFTNSLSNGGDWEFKIGGGGFEDRKFMLADKYGGADNVRLAVDSSGNLLVGTTSSSFGEKLSVQSTASNTNIAYLNYTFTDDRSNTVIQHSRATGATSATMILFRNASSSQVGSISSTGSATTYTTSSDYRLKENIAPMTGALATVTKLNPVTYTWKDGGFSGQGFIAHELQAVVPDAVVGEKDAVDAEGNPVYQGIDTSFLVATLTAAIQEQQAIITALTARVTALESN